MYIKATYTLNIFVAYSKADKAKFDEFWALLDQLTPLNSGYRIHRAWYDGQDLTAEGRETIRVLTEEADLVLLLMSDRSVVSPFFNSSVLLETLDQHVHKRSIVLPIILNTCWWEDTPFGKLEVLPKAGLPIYEAHGIKEELYEQVLDSLQRKLLVVRKRKLELEAAFDQTVGKAEAIYENWELHPAELRSALPLYRSALNLWREGFSPDRLILEARIDICEREIDFRHYAKAAKEAYKINDYQTCFFNCKDALDLRDDALIRRLYETVKAHLAAEELETIQAPFETHLHAAQRYFLQLDWALAKEEFTKALELHQPAFSPSVEALERKIAICDREYTLEDALRHATEYEQVQDYQRLADVLLDSIQRTNQDALYRMEHALQRLRDLEQVQTFFDEKSKKWGYLHKESNRILIPARYNAAYEFTEHLAGVKKLDRWGFIDIEGNEAIPFDYQYVTHFQNGIAQVIHYHDPTPYCINHRGERVEAEVTEVKVPLHADERTVEQLFGAPLPPSTKVD